MKQAIEQGKQNQSNPKFTLELLGWMIERCGEVKYGNEWICHDPYVQTDHAMDPFDAFTKSVANQSMYDFVQMMLVIQGKD